MACFRTCPTCTFVNEKPEAIVCELCTSILTEHKAQPPPPPPKAQAAMSMDEMMSLKVDPASLAGLGRSVEEFGVEDEPSTSPKSPHEVSTSVALGAPGATPSSDDEIPEHFLCAITCVSASFFLYSHAHTNCFNYK
jgi:hypothetical protein